MSKKRCPYCENLIQEKAKRCKHCKTYFEKQSKLNIRNKIENYPMEKLKGVLKREWRRLPKVGKIIVGVILFSIAFNVISNLTGLDKVLERDKTKESAPQKEVEVEKTDWESFSEKAFQRGLDTLLNQVNYENNSGYFIWGKRWDNSLMNHTSVTRGLITDGIPIEVHTWLEQGGIGSANKGVEYRANLVSGYHLPPLRGESLTYKIMSGLNEEKIWVKIRYTDKIVAGIHGKREAKFNFLNLDVLDKQDDERFKEYVKKVKLLYSQR